MPFELPPWSRRLGGRCPRGAEEAFRRAVDVAEGLSFATDEEREAFVAGRLHDRLHSPAAAALDGTFASTRPERRAALGAKWADRVSTSMLEGLLTAATALHPFSAEDVVSVWKRWRDLRDAGAVPRRLFGYVHVPFCRTRCSFCQCDALVAHGPGEVDEWLGSVLAEARRLADAVGPLPADAASIGGGTPTWLDARQLATVLDAVFGPVFTLEPGAYFSVEATPDTVTPDRLEVLARHGVNRISIGVQSLHRPTLEVIGRAYQTYEDVGRAVAAIRGAGMLCSVDLVASLPDDTDASFLRSVSDVFALAPDEVVLYPYSPVERAGRRIAAGAVAGAWAADAVRAEARRRGYDLEPNTGRAVVATRPGRRQFAVRYLQNDAEPGALLGIGAFAESHAFGVARYTRAPRLAGQSGLAGVESTVEAERGHHLARRLLRGLPLVSADYRRAFGRDIEADVGPELAYLRGRGELELHDGTYLPAAGRGREDHVWLFLAGTESAATIANALDAEAPSTDVARRRWAESPLSARIERFCREAQVIPARTALEWVDVPGKGCIPQATATVLPGALLDGRSGLLERSLDALRPAGERPPAGILASFEELAREGLAEVFELRLSATGEGDFACLLVEEPGNAVSRLLGSLGVPASGVEVARVRALVLSWSAAPAGWRLSVVVPGAATGEVEQLPLWPSAGETAGAGVRYRRSSAGEDLAASPMSPADRSALLETGVRARLTANIADALVCCAIGWQAGSAAGIVSSVWTLPAATPLRRWRLSA